MTIPKIPLALALLTWIALAPAGSAQFAQVSKLTASDGKTGDAFGSSVALTAGTALIGVFAQQDPPFAYVFEQLAPGGPFVQTQKLTPDTPELDEGMSVAIAGDTAVLGAADGNQLGQASGEAFVYERIGAGAFVETQRLVPSFGMPGNTFGDAVTFSGNTLLVAAPGTFGAVGGTVFVFERAFPGAPFQETQHFSASDAFPDDTFGLSLSLSGNTAIVIAADQGGVGAPGIDAEVAYIFDRAGPGFPFVERQKLIAGNVNSGDAKVSISKNTALISSILDGEKGNAAGAVFVYERQGALFVQTQKLTASDAASGDFFGSSVSISGDKLVVGAALKGTAAAGANVGAVYVFQRLGFGSPFAETQKLVAGDAAGSDQFGSAVAMFADQFIAGAQSKADGRGAAYAFRDPNCPVPAGSECFLLLGTVSLDVPLPMDPEDTLHVLPALIFPISGPADTPVFAIPQDPTLFGVHVYSQVFMDNPHLFPGDRYKMSNALDIALGVGVEPLGKATGMTLLLAKPPKLGGVLALDFTIDDVPGN